MKEVARCLLTGIQFDASVKFDNSNPLIYDYTFSPIGRARISQPKIIEFNNNRTFKHPVLAGICRNAFENGEQPPLIDTEFVNTGIENHKYPVEFKEKAKHLLKMLYKLGGKEYQALDLNDIIDYPLCYCTNPDEFNRVMVYLEERYFLRWHNKSVFGMGRTRYFKVLLTESGIEEVEKELPPLPMVGLVNQNISTGDFDVDEKINHARNLFFDEPQSMDKMRSACEALSYVLEPLRDKLKKVFNQKDVSDFFQIVNNFDIRHNKNQTKLWFTRSSWSGCSIRY